MPDSAPSPAPEPTQPAPDLAGKPARQSYRVTVQKWREKNPGHIPKRARILFPDPVTIGLVDRCTAALFPWKRWEYPGTRRLRAWLLGVAMLATGDDYRARVDLPRMRAKVMAGKLRAKASELLALAVECDAYAAGPGKGLGDGAPVKGKKRSAVLPPVE